MGRARLPALALALSLVALCGGRASGHVADTSYVRFKVTPTGIQTKFSFDIATLQRIVPQLDANADHRVTPAEFAAQTPAVYEFLRRRVRFEIDGVAADFGAQQPVAFPPEADPAGIVEIKYHDAASLSHFVFEHPLARPPADFWILFDIFHELGPRHSVLGAIDHEGKRADVLFGESEPDYLYDTGYQPAPPDTPHQPPPQPDAADVAASPESPPARPSSTDAKEIAASKSSPTGASSGDDASPPSEHSRRDDPSRLGRSNTNDSPWNQMWGFFVLGVEHIFLGYDHILFLLSLLVMSRFRELVKIVTSFTVAHTITLMLATLDVVRLPSRLVESAIAATIVYVAIENFWVRDTTHRWRLTFFCGLIHGFGFAGVLQQHGLPTDGLVRSLAAFNCGVEAGQLVIVAMLWPMVSLLARWRYGKQGRRVISGAIALCGAGWLVDRVFGLGFMPF